MRVRLLLGSLCCLLLPLAPLLADSHRADSGFYVAVRAGSTFTDPATGSLVRMRDDYPEEKQMPKFDGNLFPPKQIALQTSA